MQIVKKLFNVLCFFCIVLSSASVNISTGCSNTRCSAGCSTFELQLSCIQTLNGLLMLEQTFLLSQRVKNFTGTCQCVGIAVPIGWCQQ